MLVMIVAICIGRTDSSMLLNRKIFVYNNKLYIRLTCYLRNIFLGMLSMFTLCFARKQLERAYQYELWSFVTLIGLATFFYTISGYLKAVVLAFRLKGPKALFFIGNILMIGKRDCKYTLE